jgi:methanogenic corrinoid protein MtbC1
MTIEAYRDRYYDAVFDTDRALALAVVDEALAVGATPEQVVFEIVVPAIERMVKSFTEDFDATLAQHFLASQIAVEVTDAMLPRFARAPEIVGRIVIGTARGDFHGLGKKIVSGCLKAKMIQVVDLGLNVEPARFVDEAVAQWASVIGISSMMIHTARGADGPSGVRALLDARGLSGRIKLVVGGAPYRFDPELYRTVGADGWAADGMAAARVVADFIAAVKTA